MLNIRVVGSAAGGGVPQWNCAYTFSQRARSGDPAVKPRLQSCIAASAGGGVVLFNASPDIRQQIVATRELQPSPRSGPRNSPIAAVVLTNADVDHIAGLLSLRERQAFNLYATARVLRTLEENSIFRVLDPQYVHRIEMSLNSRTAIHGPHGDTGIAVEFYPVPGKVALFLETGDAGRDFSEGQGDTVGVEIRDAAGSAVAHYVPGCAAVTESFRSRVQGSDVLFFDGTVFQDDEMKEAGVGDKTGQRMGHLHIGGPGGSLERLAGIDVMRRVYIHINNTNPILDENSPQRAEVEAAGWEVAWDGMEFNL